MELWKDIPGYEGLYQASNFGNIRTAENKITSNKRYNIRRWKQRVLKPKRCKKNCLRVSLWKDGKCNDFLLARLICSTWKENLLDTNYTVNHIDGNRLNNRVENLEWLSRADNIRHGFENGLYSCANVVILHHKETGSSVQFRSFSRASESIGRNSGYISTCLRRNKCIVGADGKKYEIEVVTP